MDVECMECVFACDCNESRISPWKLDTNRTSYNGVELSLGKPKYTKSAGGQNVLHSDGVCSSEFMNRIFFNSVVLYSSRLVQ